MFRRKFIQRVTCGLAVVDSTAAPARTTVKYQVTGFTCITCAVGLDAMLRERKGILSSKSSYPNGTAVIEFNPNLITEAQVKSFIEEVGFKAGSQDPAKNAR